MSRAFPSWNRSIWTEIHLCHACSYHEIEDGDARTGHRLSNGNLRHSAVPGSVRVHAIDSHS
eukprot:COSAG01_NODE_30793_length_609_cov_1.443137_1_plen_61_part_10